MAARAACARFVRGAWRMLFAGCACAAVPAFAQTAPDAGQILQQQRALPTPPERLPVQDKPTPARPTAVVPQGAVVTIERVRITGGEGLMQVEELQGLATGIVGKATGLGQLQEVAARITQALKEKGWLLARAYLPPQDVTNGALHIAIQRGRIEGNRRGSGFDIQGEHLRLDVERVRSTVAQALFEDDADALHSLRLERGLLLLNDLPGITARSTLEKGAEPDTTRLGLQISEGPLFGGSLQFDNQGNRFTGSDRLTAQVFANNPSGGGDQLSISAAVAPRLNLATLGYALPLGFDGLSANFGLTNLNYRLGEEMAALQSQGVADTLNAALAYPIVRSRDFNLRAQASLEHKALRDESLGTVVKDRRVDVLGLGMSTDRLDRFGGGGLFNAWITGSAGNADFSRVSADVAADALAQTAGRFAKLQLGVGRLQRLTEQLSLYGAFSAQRASHNLPSSEKFILGGPAGVRAYPGGEGSGDDGELANLELRYDVPALGEGRQLQISGFLDAGRISVNKFPWPGSAGNATGSNSYRLAGTGVGLTFSQSAKYTLRAIWSNKLGDNPGRSAATGNDSDGKNARSRFWLMATLRF